MFWNKNKAYDDTELKKRILDIELDLEKFKGQIISLRGYINRKAGKLDIEEEEKPEDPFKKMLIPVK